MDLLIRFLVMSLNTIDGNKDSAEFFIQEDFRKEVKRREKKLKESLLSKTSIKNGSMYKKEDLELSL